MKGFDGAVKQDKGPIGSFPWPTRLDAGPYGDEAQSVAKRLLTDSDNARIVLSTTLPICSRAMSHRPRSQSWVLAHPLDGGDDDDDADTETDTAICDADDDDIASRQPTNHTTAATKPPVGSACLLGPLSLFDASVRSGA